MIELEPFGCFGIVEDEGLVATTTLLTYGFELAWVGMVLTHPEYRRRGHARQLVTAALELAGARNIGCVKLDATDQGRPLYTSLGFEDEEPVERWHRPVSPIGLGDPASTGQIPLSEDLHAFGVDRSRFLKTLGAACIVNDAYAWDRPGSKAWYLGPCVARNVASARHVVVATLTRHPESAWFWDLLPSNTDAVALAREFGFEPVRRLTRMVKGTSVRGANEIVFAIAGFEAG
jgi:hypothetical protein